MANLLRYAKSASHWTKKDLLANNITLAEVDAAAFFNVVPLPQPRAKDVRLFFQHLNLAKNPISMESRVDDFGAHLHLLGYDDQERIICQKLHMTFPMAGETVIKT